MTQRLAIVFVGGLTCFGCGGDNPMGPSQTALPPAAPPAPMAPVPKPAPAAVASGPVFYDARDRAKLPAGVEREPKLVPEVEKLVFSALSASYKSKREDCQGTDDVLFHVRASATGAFTAPATKQTAYLVASGPCAAAGAEAIEATHLVVVDADKVSAQATSKLKLSTGEPFPQFYGTDIRAVVDVDGDGIGEILVGVESTLPAGVDESVRLVSVAGGAAKRLWSFAGVYKDACGATPPGKVQAQVLHYIPGVKDPAARYPAEIFEAACSPAGAPKVTDFLLLKVVVPAAAPAAPAASPSAPAAAPSAAATPPGGPAASPSPTAVPAPPSASPAPTTVPSPQPSP
jgi:hypothetical protein